MTGGRSAQEPQTEFVIAEKFRTQVAHGLLPGDRQRDKRIQRIAGQAQRNAVSVAEACDVVGRRLP